MSMNHNEPKVRVRINHSRTVKNGWGHETTIEIDEFTAGPGADLNRMCKELMQDLDTLAREESARRNALDEPVAA